MKMKKCLWILIAVLCMIDLGLAVNEAAVSGRIFVYKDEGKRDPFWPLVTENGAIISYDEEDMVLSDMALQGIVAGSGGNIAIINGKIVKEGDMVGAFRVERVTPAFVVLDNKKEKIELYLKKEE